MQRFFLSGQHDNSGKAAAVPAIQFIGEQIHLAMERRDAFRRNTDNFCRISIGCLLQKEGHVDDVLGSRRSRHILPAASEPFLLRILFAQFAEGLPQTGRFIKNDMGRFREIRQKHGHSAARLRLGKRQHIQIGQGMDRYLRGCVKLTQTVDFIAKKLHADRPFTVNGEQVNDAAAHAELSLGLHLVSPLISAAHQGFQENIPSDFRADGQMNLPVQKLL